MLRLQINHLISFLTSDSLENLIEAIDLLSRKKKCKYTNAKQHLHAINFMGYEFFSLEMKKSVTIFFKFLLTVITPKCLLYKDVGMNPNFASIEVT